VQRAGSSRRAPIAIVALVALVGSVFVVAQANAAVKTQVRGFDGTTITVGSMGYKANFAKGDVGPTARIKRFNANNEIKGIKLKYVGFEDDGNDPASALSVARRLVTEDGVFALVGDASSYNPVAYFKQSHVPFFGWGFDNAYCNPKVPTNAGWGFGYNGCQVNTQPARVVDYAGKVYQYVSQQLNKKNPTVALINDDGATFRATMAQNVISYKGSGFDVVFAKSIIPAPPAPVSDYSPYTAKLLTSNNGGQPDVITCLSGLQCLQLYTLLHAQGFKGIFQHALYTDIFVKPMADTIVTASNANFNATNIPSLDQMRTDIAAVDPDQAKKLDAIALAGYSSTDMFIQVLKQVVKNGGTKAITPEAVQKAASKVFWEMKGFTGPISYPVASNYQGGPTTGYCTGLFKSDGTTWNTVVDYSCSKKTYPFKQ
jgi:ABC-type branched-subunit amino acid transport system substrate-binding protein